MLGKENKAVNSGNTTICKYEREIKFSGFILKENSRIVTQIREVTLKIIKNEDLCVGDFKCE